MKSFRLYAVLWCVIWGSCTSSPQTTDAETNGEQPVSLEEKIGQMLLIGFRGTSLSDTNHVVRDVRDLKVGGVIFYNLDVPNGRTFPRNIESPEQVKKLSNDLQALSDIPLFISIDQEGGRVNRLKKEYGFPAFDISAQHIGDTNVVTETEKWGQEIATTLSELEINLNFAPSIDVNINPASPAIGNLERSISADPKEVAKHATIFVNEHRKANIGTSLKHFPGHGSAMNDSHAGFTDVTKTWEEKELEPYRQMIEQGGIDMIMTAHVYNESWDTVPSTMSYNVINNMLRENLKWDGIVISDDMQMGAIADNFGLATALEKSINAGVDIFIFSNNSPAPYDAEIAPKAIDTIKKLVAEGKVKEERIDEAYQRIMDFKKRWQ